MVSGTGRAGTTLLMRVLTRVGLDTGFGVDEPIDPLGHCGLERFVSQRPDHRIVKSPWFALEAEKILDASDLVVDHVIICIRDLASAAESRRRVQAVHGDLSQVPGGLWETLEPDKQEAALAEIFHHLVFSLTAREVPVTFIHFPRFAEDHDYAIRKLSPIFPEIDHGKWMSALRAEVRPDWITIRRPAASAGFQASSANWRKLRIATDKNLIFDIGMHHGQDSEYYLKMGFRVVAVEANPHCVEIAKQRLAPFVATGQLVIENVGISDGEGTRPFYVNRTMDEWSSFIPHLGKRMDKFDVLEVPITQTYKLIEKHGMPHYLKVDIEGLDKNAILDLWRFQERPAYVSYEAVPDDLSPLAHLYSQGYDKFKLVDQIEIPKLRLKKESKDGQLVDLAFEQGSTGPFGEDCPGTWSTLTQVIQDYFLFWKFRANDPRLPPTWIDIHARHSSTE